MEKYISNSGKEFVILSQTGKSCVIQFLESGSVRKANKDNIIAGKVRDLYAISCYGVGYEGVVDKSDPTWKAGKQLWRNMLKRCYCEADARGYFGKGITVDPRWHCLANFLQDIKELQNYDKWVIGKRSGTKFNLDKDLLFPGCNVYSKETCWFVEESINKSAGARNGKPYSKNPKMGKE